jgi:hypothetical protein
MSTEPQLQGDPQKTDINALQYAIVQWEEYLKESLSSAVLKTYMQMYDRVGQTYDKKKDTHLVAFQKELQRIPDMVTGQLGQLNQDVSSFFEPSFNLKKTIKTIILHRTMLASSIRPHSKANQRFDVPLPTPESFIHKVMSISAISLFQWPSLFDRSPKTNTEESRLKKYNKVYDIIMTAINKAVIQLMPYGELQDAYLSDAAPPQGQPVPPPAAAVPQPVVEDKQPEVKQPVPEIVEDPELKAGFKASSSKGKAQKRAEPEEDDDEDSGSGSGSGSESGSDDDNASQAAEETDEEQQPQKTKKRSPPEPPKKSSKKHRKS